jgi:hypothetical protein
MDTETPSALAPAPVITRGSDVLPRAAAALVLALVAGLAGSAAFRESVAIDEIAHIGAGVSYLQKLDLRFNPEHPPLAKALAALPLVLTGVRTDYDGHIWTWSGQGPFNPMLAEWSFGAWVIGHWNDPMATLRWARLPMLLLLLATGFVIYVFGQRLAGGWGGLFALCWFATMPAFLAFGPLVLTDTAVALFSLLALWTFATLWRDRTPFALLRFAVALALALLSKFSAGLLLFVFAAFPLALRFFPVEGQPKGEELRAWRRRGLLLTLEGVAGAAVLVYLAEMVLSWNEPTDLLKILGTGPLALALRRLLLPVVTYLGGVVLFLFGSVRPTYLLGKAYPHGVWFFFPVVTLLKSTLAFVAALGLSAAAGLAHRSLLRGKRVGPAGLTLHWRALWLGMVLITAACLLSPMSISIRHFTVPLALLCLLLAPVPRLLQDLEERWAGMRVGPWVAWGLAVASLVTVVRAWPYYMSFFNSLAGGRPGYELVSDSNLDWDTQLPEVERFVEREGLDRVLLDSYNVGDPTAFVPKAELWSCQAATAADAGRWAVVSANMFADGENCSWLLAFPHDPLAGGSMYAFHLPEVIGPPGSPGGPPAPSGYRYMAGMPFDWRDLIYRCIRDPGQMQATMERMAKMFQDYHQNRPK